MNTPQIDLATALARLEGDPDLLRELIAMFIADGEGYLDDIHAALQRGDRPALQRAAHTLKGVLATFCAEPAGELAARLEHAAREQSPDQLAILCSALDQAVRRLRVDLQSV